MRCQSMKINKKFTKAARRMLSVAVCLVMMFTTFFIFDPSVLKITASAAAWSGSTSATSGTDYTISGSTMHIKTPNGLAWFMNNLGTYASYTVYLDNDIDLGGSNQWVRNGTEFKGIFDGQDHTISKMNAYCGYREDLAGLFLKANGATIRNLKFDNCFVGTTDGGYGKDTWYGKYGLCVGNVVTSKVTLSNITVTSSRVSGRTRIGGLVGEAETSIEFTNCNVSCRVTGVRLSGNGSKSLTYWSGGYVGKVSGDFTATNCTYSNATHGGETSGVVGRQQSGGLVGYLENGTNVRVENCYNTATISNTGDSPKCSGGLFGEVKATTIQFINCSNSGAISCNGIYCGGFVGYSEGSITISGKLSSQAYTNSGVITSYNNCVGGLIGQAQTVSLINCTNNGSVTGTDRVGGLLGNGTVKLTISQCNNNGTINGQQYVGGLNGATECSNAISITDSINNGNISGGHKHIGGIAGILSSGNDAGIIIKNCSNTAQSFTAQNENVGGILGKNNSDKTLTLENCHNTSTLNVKANWIGGLVGYDKGKLVMKNCTNTANITGYQYTAGLIAGIEDDGCEITNCLNTGAISTSGNSNGAGILSTVQSQTGSSVWKFTNTVNTGNVSGVSALGGFIGYLGNLDKAAEINFSDCVNKGNITSTGNDVGGFAGNIYNHGSSSQHHKYINCYNYGNISSNSGSTDGVFVGGIVGKEYGFAEFNGCRNYGTVNASSTSANSISGGICGWIEDDTSSFADCINYGKVTAKNNIGGILGEVSNAYNGSSFSFTQCGNYGGLSATTNNFADMGGIVGKLNAKESTVKIYMSKCFNGNGKDGRIASVSYKAKNAGGLFGEVNKQAVIADSYNNASSISSGTNAGGLIGTNNGNTALAYNSFSVTASVSNLAGSGSVTQYGCFTNTMGKGTAALATLNTTRTVSGISSVGNAYDYKQGVNKDYPALKWQLNTLTKNVGRNLIADLIADTANSGYRAQGLPYDIKLDGVTKTYYPTYTKTENGVTVTYNTMSDLFTLSGTPTSTGTFEILSGTNPEAKNVYFSAYYVGGNAMGCSATVYTSTISRTSSTHALKSLSAGERIEVFASVNPNVPVQFDNYKFHASMDYVNNVTATSGALIDLHSTYSGLGTPTKEGYKFLGWYTVRAKGDVISDGSTVANFGTPSFDDTLDRDVDIYAHWDPISYTIRYNGNGSTGGSTGKTVHIYDEAKNLEANGFYRKFDVNLDYCNGRETETLTATSSFLGWATSPDGEPIYSNGQSVKNLTTEDGKIIDLYAKWAADSSVELPTPTMTGYTFDGWYTSDGTKVSQTFTPTAPTNLTAHWTPITYTVSYDGNGGSGSTASSTHTYDVAQNLTKNGFERKFTVTFNYNDGRTETRTVNAVSTFTGWICSKDGKTYADGAEVKNLTDKSETITMTAQWTDASVDIPTPARSGYTFSGWTDQEGKQVSGRITPTKDITLTANWDAITYTVSYDGNGGSGSTASSTHTYDVAQNLTKNGFERKFTVTFNYNDGVTSNTVSTVKSDFNGWICSKDEKTYADEAEVKNLTDKSEEITMTAQWTDKTVTVPETERENYIFLGWFDAQGNEYKGTFTPTSDLVITAKWQEKAKYTVTFKNGDEILQQSEWYVDTMPTFNGTEPTKESDNRYEYTFSGWSPEITKVTGEAVYEAQFTATEHHFKSVKVDGETHRSECACGYKLESTKHNIELKDGKYTCKDCGYVVPDFTAVTADGATLTKTLRADMTTKYLVATVSYPNASKPNKEGKYFVYWYDRASGEIVSAFTTYSFFLTKEVDIVPVFATQKDYYTERAKATTVLRMVGCKQNEDKSYSILAERSISSSAGSINSHGMIYTTDASLVDKLTVEGKDEDESIRLLTAQRTSTVRTGLYEAKITGAESGVVYARPYIVLVKADGSTETVYGKVVTYNLLTSTQAAESDVLSTNSYDLSDISAEEPVTPTEPTEKNPLEKIADFFAKLVEIIKTILSFFGLTGVAR